MDLVFALDRLPRAGETLAGGDLALFPGGKGANQAYAAAKLGGNVSIIAAVGADSFGQALLSSLARAGVDTSRIKTSARPTGCACIYVMPGGENSIVISPGANADLDAETALSQLHDLAEGDFLLAMDAGAESEHHRVGSGGAGGLVCAGSGGNADCRHLGRFHLARIPGRSTWNREVRGGNVRGLRVRLVFDRDGDAVIWLLT